MWGGVTLEQEIGGGSWLNPNLVQVQEPIIRVGISTCLLGEPVRYDGLGTLLGKLMGRWMVLDPGPLFRVGARLPRGGGRVFPCRVRPCTWRAIPRPRAW